MKYMLIFTSAVALAVASPHHRGLVGPGAAGPAPAPESEPIAIGPGVLDYKPIAVGHEVVDLKRPVIPPPAPMIPEDIVPPVAPVPVGNPLVQFIININGQQFSVPGNVGPPPAHPGHVVDSAPKPVDIGPAVVPKPVAIGVPLLPYPVIMPDELN